MMIHADEDRRHREYRSKRRRLLQENSSESVHHHPVDFTIPSRNRTLLLLRMCLAAYPTCQEKIEHGKSCDGYSLETMKDIFDQGLSIYGPDISTMEQESLASKKLADENWDILTKTNSYVPTVRSIPHDKAKFDFGVSAIEWTAVNDDATKNNNTTILVFRGTYSDGDYANIENWMIDYVLEKSTDRMERAWVDDAGLEWTKDLEDRASAGDQLDKIEIRTFESYRKSNLPQELVEAIANNTTLQEATMDDDIHLTLQEAKASGYWQVTKYIVDQVHNNAISNNRTLIITGHSQGGTRAQLASMYLQKKTGTAYPTITFAATGSACMARLLFDTNANLLDDVNPFIPHDQMIDYVHPLDPWGNSMLGEDNGGQTCFWGKNSLIFAQKQKQQQQDTSNPGDSIGFHFDDGPFTYCSMIYGTKGPTLIANEFKKNAGGGNNDLKANFKRCRYFTHMIEAMLYGLQNSLAENGTTTGGGCHAIAPILQDDPDGKCSIGKMSLEEDEVVGLIIFIAFVSMAFLGCFLYNLGRCSCCRPRGICSMSRNRQHVPLRILNDFDNAEIFESEEEGTGLNDEIDVGQSSIELPQIT